MWKGIGITAAVIVSIGGLAWFTKSLKDSQGQDLTKQLGIEQKLSAKVESDIVLRDENGKNVKFGELFQGRPVVLLLAFYTCKSACLSEFESSVKTYRSISKLNIGKDYDVVTVSINPTETPELARAKRAQYLDLYNRQGTDNGWHFLTGDYNQVQRLAKDVGFKYSYDAKEDRVVHPTGLIILTPTMRVSKYFLGTSYPVEYFTDSLTAAASNQVGALAEPVSVGCFTIDPSTGKTFVTAQNALRITGSITVLAMALGIWGMLRTEKSGRGADEARAHGKDTKE